MEYALLGERLGHSFSPELHAMIGLEGYGKIELSPADLPPFMRDFPLKGANVTIPYKQAVIPYLSELSESAQLTGAVNTIVNRAGRLCGYNTDLDGFIALARHLRVDFTATYTVILGAGGAAKAVGAAALKMGAGKVVNAVRNPSAEGQIPISEPQRFADADIIVNCTPVGMSPDIESSIIDISGFRHLSAVLDCIYNPLRTNLVLDAQAAGIQAEGGLYMLVAQAVEAQKLFRGADFGPDVCDRVFYDLLRSKRNIVLCGMPTCGKSSVGKVLAARTCRELIDTDQAIVDRAGMSVQEIFARGGEELFRKLEEETIGELSSRQGIIISTGGGAVLRDCNVRSLKRNGVICLLERSLDKLKATPSRPLSATPEALRALYEARIPRYRAVADIMVLNDGPLLETVDHIV
ncbi:MAG: hypothetical protein J5764_01380, partial [Bacteroidales bacterium]|nr:hypothetical protein [Bacteroidales bacterium]